MWKSAVPFLFIIALMGCQKSSPENTTQHNKQPLQKITVAYSSQPQSALIHIAVAKGYFVEEGFEVQPFIFGFGKAALQALLDNKADFATVAETPIMFSVLRGDKIAVIANMTASTTDNAVVVRQDAGISSPSDLKGKRIGFTPGTTNEFFLDSLLTASGMTMKEITQVPLKPEEMQDAIMTRKVDAVSTWNYPLALIRQQLGNNGRIFYDQDIYTELFNLVAMQKLIDNHPEMVQRFLRAVMKAEHFLIENQVESQAIVAAATKTDKNLVREVWNVFKFHVVLDQTILITLEDETRWAMKSKLTDQTVMPNYLGYIHINSLKTINPEAVNINR
jgi:ABC-type nitrate/sulfonate/bicarbonate transport system substrate-binding protein